MEDQEVLLQQPPPWRRESNQEKREEVKLEKENLRERDPIAASLASGSFDSWQRYNNNNEA